MLCLLSCLNPVDPLDRHSGEERDVIGGGLLGGRVMDALFDDACVGSQEVVFERQESRDVTAPVERGVRRQTFRCTAIRT